MKQFNLNVLPLNLMKSFFLSVFFLGACYATNAQTYTASLLGSNEFPANVSPGTGKAVVTINGTTMRVQVTFSGLTAPTAASHIHAATTNPGTGTAGVATTTPSFVGFPSGVTSGTYDHTYDMTLTSSYNASYITANGGTAVSAFAALKGAISNGKAYLNIHTSAFPAGEIRCFLVGCPTITVSIPDAFALGQGTLPNTVYPAYTPASSLTLVTAVSGGSGPYSYNWSNGSIASAVSVSPVITTQYSVTVQDQNGCTGTASKTVNVMDIAGGKKGDKIVLCHNGNTITIDNSAVAVHLGHGDMLGSCPEKKGGVSLRSAIMEEHRDGFVVKVSPNPSPNYFELKIEGNTGNKVKVSVYDLLGRVVETRPSIQSGQTLRLGASYAPGIYSVEILQGAQKQILKLVKEK